MTLKDVQDQIRSALHSAALASVKWDLSRTVSFKKTLKEAATHLKKRFKFRKGTRVFVEFE